MAYLASLALIFLLSASLGEANVNCSAVSTCSECISLASCLWCAQPASAHCLSQNDTESSSCSEEYLLRTPSNITEIDELPVNEQNQVSLQSIDLKLRVGEPVSFKVSVKAAEDYPLDLYVLMDFSFSFRNDLVTVKGIAPQLPLSLRNVSSTFQISFGTFVDKPMLPYISNCQLNKRCRENTVSLPHSYEHLISLTNSSELFNSSVQGTNISTNVDNPEGTLDAMLQVAVCDEVIGWREASRKILLVMTDDGLHIAGDGILAGIAKPNDGNCHTQLDTTVNKVLYDEATRQDYPSIELVRLALIEDNIVPVFAVPNEDTAVLDFFNNTISPLLGGYTVELTADSDNLIQVLNDAYRSIVSNARLSFSLPAHISASVTANCSNYQPETMECTEIGNNTIEFTVTLTLNECTDELTDGENGTEIQVNIPGFAKFSVNVEGHCSCDCEQQTTQQSTDCSGNGNLTCGTCDCDEAWSGSNCSCSTADCPVGFNSQTCSGRGQCICGECQCNQASSTAVDNPFIYGESCECSNYECDTDAQGRVCGGQGNCTCDRGVFTCQCHASLLTGEQRTGDHCQCSTDHCINPSGNGDSRICSGQGTCRPCEPQGMACVCHMGFSGSYCQQEVYASGSLLGSCSNGTNIRQCVICYGDAAKNGETASNCDSRVCQNYTLLDSSPSDDDYEVPTAVDGSTVDCSFISGECQYSYYAGMSADLTHVYAVPPPQCLLIPIWAIAVTVLVGLVLIGICVLVAIKCCCMYLDHREFKRFRMEVTNANFSKNLNPMYHGPEVQYQNIAYGRE